MKKAQLQQEAAFMRRSLFDQGYLDEQFEELEGLQDDSNPNFVEEIVTLFYNDSARMLSNIEHALLASPMDFDKLDDYMHQFKGSSSGIGAKRVKLECARFDECCAARNADGCNRIFQQVKHEYTTLKKQLQAYFQVAREASQM
ncbi:histidine-containing phosphotransfer protein 4-like [Prosopis cineraria]|uniref:histidine-containing phosphotransfer protein 4-like n=1 Tax=Prosopis cineraria TaxID=364024 RepID=UPI00240F9B53|nr:histidine-containing phosphotransfer protein 4-like [Prosopis cineraria]